MREHFLCIVPAIAVLLATASCRTEGPEEIIKERVVVKEVLSECEPCPPCEGLAAPAKATGAPADKGPDECILYHLVDLYGPTVFSHSNHVEYEERCEICHHHSSEVETAPPCRECHGLPSTDLDRPGLKGAYHRQCMNCHREMGSGPMGCEECHPKRDQTGVEQEALARLYVANTMKLGHMSREFGEVTFDHKLHAEVSDTCGDCHHHQKGYEVTPPCRECHNRVESVEGERLLGLKDAYHQQCLTCHRAVSKKHDARIGELEAEIAEAREAGKAAKEKAFLGALKKERGRGTSPLKCVDCHLPLRAPESVTLGKLSKQYVPVIFDHKLHVVGTSCCTDCHHDADHLARFQPCGSCHGAAATDGGAKTTKNLQDAYHEQCITCHKRTGSGPEDCSDCHEERGE